jgi:tripartite-type tricarboxylate transporter receptor subunit TctC
MREVPTLNESGLPGLDATSWYAVVAQFVRGEMDKRAQAVKLSGAKLD